MQAFGHRLCSSKWPDMSGSIRPAVRHSRCTALHKSQGLCCGMQRPMRRVGFKACQELSSARQGATVVARRRPLGWDPQGFLHLNGKDGTEPINLRAALMTAMTELLDPLEILPLHLWVGDVLSPLFRRSKRASAIILLKHDTIIRIAVDCPVSCCLVSIRGAGLAWGY